MARQRGMAKRRLGTFDLFVLAGAATNGLVIVILLAYWVTH